MKNSCIVAMLLAGLALPARAGFFEDSYNLRYLCQGEERLDRAATTIEEARASAENLKCIGYIEGVLDGLDSAGQRLLCAPRGMRVGQAKDLITHYLQTHVEHLHEPAADLVIAALRAAFPCIRQ